MATTKVTIEGADALARTLKAAASDLGDLKELHADVGRIVARTGADLAPRETGRLAGSIRSSGTAAATLVRAGGAALPYAGVQEFGWPARRIPAHPYLTESLSRNEPAIINRYEREVDRVLSQVHGV